jgi:hypothetical protein
MPPSTPSPPDDSRDPRTLRLFDLAPFEAILVRCECGRMTEYGPGLLQRLHRIPSDTLIYDLQYRLRCQHCNRRDEFDIGILDTRPRGDNRRPPSARPVVQRER